jgi:hypothetical protein
VRRAILWFGWFLDSVSVAQRASAGRPLLPGRRPQYHRCRRRRRCRHRRVRGCDLASRPISGSCPWRRAGGAKSRISAIGRPSSPAGCRGPSVRGIASDCPSGESEGLMICHCGARLAGIRSRTWDGASSGDAGMNLERRLASVSVRSTMKYSVLPSKPITLRAGPDLTRTGAPPAVGFL